MKPLLLGALASFLAGSALIAAYWALFLRPYDRGMDGFTLTDDESPRPRKEPPMTRILAPAAAILTGALLGLIAVWVWLATVSLDIPVL